MTLLQFIIIISSIIFLIFAMDAFQRKKINMLHLLVFIGGGILLLVFSINIQFLNKFGQLFGVTRGADLIVYTTLILLGYFYFELLHTITKIKTNFSKFITNEAIHRYNTQYNLAEEIQKNQSTSKLDQYCLLIRAYNEDKYIASTLEHVVNFGFSKIIIVNDGSQDQTFHQILQIKNKYPDKIIIPLTHLVNRGGGAANKTLFTYVKKYGQELNCNWYITYDADGQMDIHDMYKFISYIENQDPQVDILLGSRFLPGGKAENIPTLRKIILWGSKIITLMFNGIRVTDPHNGYRVINYQALKKIIINSDGMTYASELLEEIKRLKLKYAQIPVNIIYTEYSLRKGQKSSNAFKILAEIIYKKFFFK